ncbi:hypothetical protein [Rhizobium sp. AAP43]|uniref:hypothetical protein n=1 Tax=Rhizobium sp. AAP43 TaxID=1523420 RepID=UPI0006B9D96A|nr:hypothetical protein [Rhizobium sp. AAP43]KPF47093.1 hypothetical protein IP76_02005 [Rhizobium sp. AAP43]
MADITRTPPTRAQVTSALHAALKKLHHRGAETLPETCADLWDDSLELIELLMAIEEELDAEVRCNAEFDWRGAPQQSATTAEFVDWIVKETRNG